MVTGSEAGEQVDAEVAGLSPVGRITSSAKGHSVGKMLALAYVAVTHSWPGARLMVMGGDRPVPATVVTTPFFDPAGLRLRGTSTRTIEEQPSATGARKRNK